MAIVETYYINGIKCNIDDSAYRDKTPEELAVFKRGRNANVNTIPHSASRSDYLKATALESLFGFLYLRGETERINELFNAMMEVTRDAT